MMSAAFASPPRIASLHPHGVIWPRTSAVTKTAKRVEVGDPPAADAGAPPGLPRVQAASSVAAMRTERSCKVPSAEGRPRLPPRPGPTRVVDRPPTELV